MFWFNLIWFAGVLFLLFLAARNFFRFALMLVGIHTPSSHMGYWGWHPNAMIASWGLLFVILLILDVFFGI